VESRRWPVGEVVDGRYKVLAVHDGGSMGLVYRVRHLEWGTDLAVKTPRPELASDTEWCAGFTTEAEAWMDLEIHPNVCACEYVRVLDGVPRVFAEYVAGGSLLDRIRDRTLYDGGQALGRILDLAIQMAWGLEHAHAKNLVHRDVKSANVLLDADDQAKITDFGLARSGGGFTHAYASWEQLDDQPTDHRTDVFSYAVTVLELFTGGAAWEFGTSAGEVLARLRKSDPPEPRLPVLPPELAVLLDECLREKLCERPGSFTEIAARLTSIYQAVPGIRHRRIKPKAADLRADEHNNRALSLLDLNRPHDAEHEFVSALRAVPGHLAATYNAGLTRWRSGLMTDTSLIGSLEAVPADAPSQRLLAQVHIERGDLTTARALLAGAERDPEASSLLALLDDQMPVDAGSCAVRTLSGDGFESAALSRDGRKAVTGSKDGTVRLWDARTGGSLVLREADGHAGDISLSDDGRRAAVSTGDTAYLWDLTTGRCLQELGVPDGGRTYELSYGPRHGFLSVHLAPDGNRALAVDHRARVWDLFSGQVKFGLDEFRDSPEVLVDMPSRRLLSCGKDDRVRIWDLDSGQVLHTLPVSVILIRHAGMVTSDGKTVVLKDRDNHVGVWNLESGRKVDTLHRPVIWSAAAQSEASGLALTANAAGSVCVWEVRSGRCLRTFHGHKGEVAAVRISEDGRTGLSVGRDGTLRRWALPSGGYHAPYQLSRPRLHRELNDLDAQADLLLEAAQEAIAADRREEALQMIRRVRSLPGQEYMPRVRAAWRAAGEVTRWTGPRAPRQELALNTGGMHRSVALAVTRPIAALGGADIQLWDLEAGTLLWSVGGHLSPVSAVAFSRDGSRLCSATRDGEISLWSVSSGERLRRQDGRGTAGATAAAFTDDGRLALIGGSDNRVVLWDLANAEKVVLGRHNSTVPTALTAVPPIFSTVTSAWISPHGEIGATTGGDGLVRIWDLPSHESRCVLRGHTHWTGSVCLSTDLRFALSSGEYDDHRLRLWDLASGTCLRVFDEVPEVASTVRLTPNCAFALSAGKDGNIRVWNVSTGHCIRVLEAHPDEVSDLAVSADGWRAASVGNNGVLQVWDLDWDLSAL
jgi:WD40 repeat protein/serine/threonine protein kinase